MITLSTPVTESDSAESETNCRDSEVDSDGSVSEEAKSENDESDGLQQGNSGWADSIAKILKTNKPKRKRTLVLSKAKKLSDVKKQSTEYVGFEIEGEDGKIKKEKLNSVEPTTKDLVHNKQVRKKVCIVYSMYVVP